MSVEFRSKIIQDKFLEISDRIDSKLLDGYLAAQIVPDTDVIYLRRLGILFEMPEFKRLLPEGITEIKTWWEAWKSPDKKEGYIDIPGISNYREPVLLVETLVSFVYDVVFNLPENFQDKSKTASNSNNPISIFTEQTRKREGALKNLRWWNGLQLGAVERDIIKLIYEDGKPLSFIVGKYKTYGYNSEARVIETVREVTNLFLKSRLNR